MGAGLTSLQHLPGPSPGAELPVWQGKVRQEMWPRLLCRLITLASQVVLLIGISLCMQRSGRGRERERSTLVRILWGGS